MTKLFNVKQNTIAEHISNIFEDFYYYGLNYSNSKVKKMYDEVKKDKFSSYILNDIDRCRLLGITSAMSCFGQKYAKLIEDALLEIPSAAMNGLSPNKREELLIEEETLEDEFISVPQNNAHVHRDIAKKFYYYYFALLEYTNNKYKINDKINKIFKQENIDPHQISSIEEYLWNHKEIIDDFIHENPYKFDENDFYYVEQFKTGLTNDNYYFLGTDREYAKFLSKDKKIYMVKGLNSNLDEVLDTSNVPYMVSTHLLMFENNIIYTGLIGSYEFKFPSDIKKMILKEIKSAIKYYHF